jgi:hypothetical protein
MKNPAAIPGQNGIGQGLGQFRGQGVGQAHLAPGFPLLTPEDQDAA